MAKRAILRVSGAIFAIPVCAVPCIRHRARQMAMAISLDADDDRAALEPLFAMARGALEHEELEQALRG